MIKRTNKAYLIILSSLFILAACQPSNKQVNAEPTTESKKKTQAILLTQSFDYDNTNKNKISGDYVAKNKLVVPQNLEPQNKWVMFEGPVLENDLIAYRFYMDSRHRNDIYGKRVKDLVMDTVGWDYHNIMDWGSDILKVGESLGIGSPAIFYQDSIYALSNCREKTVEITENGDDKSTIRTTFNELVIGEDTLNIIQDWSISAGEAWCEIELEIIDDELPEGMRFATGIVKHLEDHTEGASNGSLYAYTWGKQSFHKENMGMGLMMDQGFQPENLPNSLSHVYIFNNATDKVSYRFLAAWERDAIGVKDASGFQELIEAACKPVQ
ncbi:MAG: DUF4861 family protein [Bacteroidota bacterium]